MGLGELWGGGDDDDDAVAAGFAGGVGAGFAGGFVDVVEVLPLSDMAGLLLDVLR